MNLQVNRLPFSQILTVYRLNSLNINVGSVFKFKQFEIDQNGCAMKINTDGVLLGAIAAHQLPHTILDIGTGTGVIALMLAQRFPAARVDAVEIDESAAIAARKNFTHSPFAERTEVFTVGFERFETIIKYDLIVSNPPYFVNDLKSLEKRKEIARHADEDFFEMLLRRSAALLTDQGSLWLILPVKQAEKVVVNAVLYKLFPSKIIHIYSDAAKTSFRQIVCLDFKNKELVEEHIYIYASEGIYTDQYKQVLSNFFLAF
ncbi:tRNA1(Val) (adenine(37)-N6)-methyltransferase [Pedobacter sp. L105]|uniref:tRNA1(Val) (adenine(37)-N6)-methyltransferase n=1 Tax=Pedobacter sp. L105 TaxID=1641871 RepID=UPI0020B14410|nr:methyltransferase [Pedobacter sp. L105]